MSAHEAGGDGAAWRSRYADIAELLTAVRRNCPQVAALGIPTLQLRHPLLSDQLELLEVVGGNGSLSRAGRNGHPSLPVIAGKWLWCVLFACRETLQLMVAKGIFASRLKRLMHEPARVILKTWCFGPRSLNDSGDFYYGTLPQQLAARGVGCLLLCGDTRGAIDTAFIRAVLQHRAVRAVPEQLLIPIWAPAVVVWRQWRAALALRRLARHAPDPCLASSCAVASRWSLQPITLRNTVQFYIARSAVRRWRAKVFVTFYEGQPWEPQAWQGAKAADPGCVSVGYQHTIVMPHSQSLISPPRDSKQGSAPDVVLCVGEATRRMLEPGHTLLGTRLVTFGSFRRAPEGPARPPQPQLRTVLVLPEGNLMEARLLFNFAMRAARLAPDHHFIFRCHPLLPFDRVRAHLDDTPERLPNIELSECDPITADFSRSSVLVYRGSSAVLYAVLHGLKPVYVHDDEAPDIDPLFEATGWRGVVASPQDLREILHAYASAGALRLIEEWSHLTDYVKTYAMPVDDTSIDQFLSAVHGACER